MYEASKLREKELQSGNVLRADPEYTEKTFKVDVDHFTNSGYGTSPQYEMRYLTNDKNVKGNDVPILFYCGNEGVITDFYENSGYMTETLA